MDTGEELRFDRGADTPERLTRRISRLAAMTAAQMTRAARTALRAVGAHKDHYVVLAALAEFGPASQAALATRSHVFTSDLVAVLNDLEAGGWVRRAPDPADRRRNVITLTEPGARRLDELDRVLEQVDQHILAPLDPDERAQLFALLDRVNRHLADAGTAAPDPP
ncbi:MarR family winged helix-turn-helix transcriptional regulator [Nocardia farcinica]